MTKKIFGAAFWLLMMSAAAGAASFELADTGTEDIVDYEKYGQFIDTGTTRYKYTMSDPKGLAEAQGEGIFPNSRSLQKDPVFQQFKKSGKLRGSHWLYTNSDDYQVGFYKWADAAEEPGVKLFYVAHALEKAGLYRHAIKAYYALLVFFPKSFGLTYWGTPWYIGTVAIDSINYICREHPELGIKLEGASVIIDNSFDSDVKNDVFTVTPGRLVRTTPDDAVADAVDVSTSTVIKTVGEGPVKLLQYDNKHWQLVVLGKPFYIRGIAYMPNKVGLSPDDGTLNVHKDWMYWDKNNNGLLDAPYEAWVDKNRNNIKNRNDKTVGDFKLMQDMGVNVLRLYDHVGFNKDLLMDGYKSYGFMYLIGDPIGMYAIGSNADWYEGTDYTNTDQIKSMLERVTQMVEEYKDEPYVLMWVLGNENNYAEPGKLGVNSGSGCRARLQPEAYYSFVNQAAKLVKSLDPLKRPVAICNGDTLYLDICAKYAPELDVFGANAYRGEHGFGSIWQDIDRVFGGPAMITEYGCPAYHPDWTMKKSEEGQAKYLKGNWMDIESNFAGRSFGNSLGGILFEWTDEWWKANTDLPLKIRQQNAEWYAKRSEQYKNLKPYKHDTVPQFGAPFLDGWSYEEWFGVTSQGDGSSSPYLRQLRPSYYEYQKMWNKYK